MGPATALEYGLVVALIGAAILIGAVTLDRVSDELDAPTEETAPPAAPAAQ